MTDSSCHCKTIWRKNGEMPHAEDIRWGGERIKLVCCVVQTCLPLFVTSSTYERQCSLQTVRWKLRNKKSEKQLIDLCMDATAISRIKQTKNLNQTKKPTDKMHDQNHKCINLWLMLLSFNMSISAGIGEE